MSGAIADYAQAIRLDPTMVHAYINRGVAWRSKGRFNRASQTIALRFRSREERSRLP